LRQRLAAAVLGVLALLLMAPAALASTPGGVRTADSAEALKGTIRDPEGEPLEGVSITVSGDGGEVTSSPTWSYGPSRPER
jgi:neutral amino acid transport system permease protein